jgi:hypothetical protein
MSQVISFRLPDETANRFKESARKAGRSVNELGAISLEEWLRQNEFAGIEFRTFNGERHACIKGALQVWQFIMVAQDYEMDVEKTAAHFQWSVHKALPGFNYYEVYSEEIDRAIEENDSWTYEKMKRILPNLGLIEVNLDDESEG